MQLGQLQEFYMLLQSAQKDKKYLQANLILNRPTEHNLHVGRHD